MLWLFIGFVCLLLVVGALFTNDTFKFAVSGIVLVGAVAFVGFIGLIIWVVLDVNSEKKESSLITSPIKLEQTSPEPDPFPFYSPDEQYGWYDRHDVPMSDRCYTSMTEPCSDLQWKRALGVSLSAEEENTTKLQWCQKFAASWGKTVEQCMIEM